MKKVLLVLSIVLLTFGCESEDIKKLEDEGIKLSTNSYIKKDDDTQLYGVVDILKGSGNYKVSVSDEKKVAVRLIDNKIYILDLDAGKSVITITDSNGSSATIDVDIQVYIVNRKPTPTAQLLIVKKGETKEIDYSSGYKDYPLVCKDESLISYKRDVEDHKITITGMKVGKTALCFEEDIFWMAHAIDVEVVDSYELIVSKNYLYRDINDKDTDIAFHIISGNGGYVVESSDESVVTCELIPFEREEIPGIISNPMTVKVYLHKPGNAIISVSDADNKEKHEIHVSVTSDSYSY